MKENSNGIGFVGMLGILFIGLKLTDYIDWSWWIVLMPVYIGPDILFSYLLFAWWASK